jgi:TPR repeat protein
MSNISDGLREFHDGMYSSAMDILLPLAEVGNAEAQCVIGNMYHMGLGVEVNADEAIKWYQQSSELGYGVASSNLAGILLSAVYGYDASTKEKADQLFRKAREQGFEHCPITSDYLESAS